MKQFIIVGICAGLLLSAGCSKYEFETNTTVVVKLTDAPYNAQQVNVEIKGVELSVIGKGDWVPARANMGTYNLLSYQDGADTTIGTATVAATNIVKEVRLIVGAGNTIMIDNKVYPLQLAPGYENNLTVLVNRKINQSIETIVVDFDAASSVTKIGEGVFILKPVLKIR